MIAQSSFVGHSAPHLVTQMGLKGPLLAFIRRRSLIRSRSHHPLLRLDTSLNFRMGSGGTQVMADYIKPSLPSPVTASICTLPMELLKRLLEGDKAATRECLALAGPAKQAFPAHTSSTPMTLKSPRPS